MRVSSVDPSSTTITSHREYRVSRNEESNRSSNQVRFRVGTITETNGMSTRMSTTPYNAIRDFAHEKNPVLAQSRRSIVTTDRFIHLTPYYFGCMLITQGLLLDVRCRTDKKEERASR
jgi:hypothetical protein